MIFGFWSDELGERLVPGQDMTCLRCHVRGLLETMKRERPFNTHGPLEKAAGLVQLSWQYSARVHDAIPDGLTT